jgi:hypothetical protein
MPVKNKNSEIPTNAKIFVDLDIYRWQRSFGHLDGLGENRTDTGKNFHGVNAPDYSL